MRNSRRKAYGGSLLNAVGIPSTKRLKNTPYGVFEFKGITDNDIVTVILDDPVQLKQPTESLKQVIGNAFVETIQPPLQVCKLRYGNRDYNLSQFPINVIQNDPIKVQLVNYLKQLNPSCGVQMVSVQAPGMVPAQMSMGQVQMPGIVTGQVSTGSLGQVPTGSFGQMPGMATGPRSIGGRKKRRSSRRHSRKLRRVHRSY